MESPRKVSFDSVADRETRLLILGSLPGEVSLHRAEYYANPTNQFWRLLEPVVGAPLVEATYDNRLAILRQAGIGLWDVVSSARRSGSLDAAIRDHSVNALGDLARRLPSLRAFAFNGGKAYRIGRRELGETSTQRLIALPSSSAAYCAMRFEAKQTEWMRLRDVLETD